MYKLDLMNPYRKFCLECLILGALCLFPFNCFAQSGQDKAENVSTLDYPVLHPRYRKWATPQQGIIVSQNPPILLWPAKRKKGVTYDIRLSPDRAFDNNATTIRSQDIPWTMFNPHRLLSNGTWYWQYRVHNEKWSDILKFRIDSTSNKAVPPPANVFLSSIPDTYPRVLINKEDEQEFIEDVRQTRDAKVIINAANNMINNPIPEEPRVNINKDATKNYKGRKGLKRKSKHLGFYVLSAVRYFGEAYILTGDQKYANRGIRWALRVASWDPKGISGYSDFGDGACMLSMALAYDTFHYKLTNVQKQLLLKRIAIRASGFYNYWINNIDAKVLSNHVWQFILHDFFQTAIAVHGQLKEANKWLTYAYELWLARAPVLGGKYGGFANGTSYFRIKMETLLGIPTTIKNYTGFDFINSTKFYKNNPYWMYYALPPGSASSGFGDNSETIVTPNTNYFAYADALSKLTGSRMAATYSFKIGQKEKLYLSDANMLRWFRLRYLRHAKRPFILPDSLIFSSKYFPNVGVVFMNSDINHINKNLMVAMRSSPYGSYGHMLADQNTFNVLYGGRPFFYMSGHKISMQSSLRLNWYKATLGHNGILIDHKGQPFGPQSYGWIPRFIDGKYLTYAVGDASNAYRSGGDSGAKNGKKINTGLTYFRRHILLIHPNIIVVYDVLRADHNATWSWLIHSPHKIHLDKSENRFDCSSRKVTAFTNLYSSNPIEWSVTDSVGLPLAEWGKIQQSVKKKKWSATAQSKHGSSKMRFLAVIRFDPGTHKKYKARAIQLKNSNKKIVVGNWVIEAELNTLKPAKIQVYRKDGKVSFTSSGELGNKNLPKASHYPSNSAKLAEFVDGKWVYKLAVDSYPSVIKEIPDRFKMNKE